MKNVQLGGRCVGSWPGPRCASTCSVPGGWVVLDVKPTHVRVVGVVTTRVASPSAGHLTNEARAGSFKPNPPWHPGNLAMNEMGPEGIRLSP